MTPLRLGHVHLKVRRLEPAVQFYTQLLGLHVEQLFPHFAFLTDGHDHHVVALQAVGDDAEQPDPYGVGLYHSAFDAHDIDGFRDAYLRLKQMGVEPYLVDHQISWAMYFDDPSGNGVEIYIDRRNSPGNATWSGRSRKLAPQEFGA